MKKHYKYFAVATIALVGWFLYPSEYYRLMSEALKIQKSHPEQKNFDGEVEPSMPNKDENDKTILGIDANKNGIRDDVDIWINRIGIDYNERMAMRQNAKAEQERLRVCSLQVKEEISKVETDTLNSWGCLHAVSDIHYDENYIRNQLKSIVYNNKLRVFCPKYFDSQVYSYGGGEGDWHKNCSFKIENEKKIIENYHRFWKFSN